jgi:hypothetical protein
MLYLTDLSKAVNVYTDSSAGASSAAAAESPQAQQPPLSAGGPEPAQMAPAGGPIDLFAATEAADAPAHAQAEQRKQVGDGRMVAGTAGRAR